MSIGPHFHADYTNNKANQSAIIQGDKFRITILSEILIRFEYSETNTFDDRLTELVRFRNFEVPKFRVDEDQKYLVIITKYFNIEYMKGKPFIGPAYSPDAYLKVKQVDSDNLWYFNHPEAKNYYAVTKNFDKKELDKEPKEKLKIKYQDIVEKQKGLYSQDGFVSIDDSQTLILTEEGNLIKENRTNIDTYLFMYKRDFGLCLRDYFRLTGTPPLIPRYALGIWWNKDKEYNFEDIKQLVNAFNRNQIPLNVLLLGEMWHIKDPMNKSRYKTGFNFNSNLFENPLQLTTYLKDRGIKLGLNIDPSEGIHPHEPQFNEVAAALKISEKITIPINVLDTDKMKIYLNQMILPLFQQGISFIWNDFYDPQDKQTLNALNYYHFNDIKRFEEKRPLLLTRLSTIAPHRIPIHYSGQTLVSWNTLKNLPAHNSGSSNIGLSWWSHDIGGYKGGIEDEELYIRYIQYGTFSPIFRLASKDGHYYKRAPWRWNESTLNVVRNYCQLRQRLIPYLYGEAYKYHQTGMPLCQPLYYVNPEIIDEIAYKNEYYFGTELLIAPITEKVDPVMNRSIHRIFLPEGTWYDFTNGKKFAGNKRYITFYKKEEYPVFARSGSIIPLSELKESLNQVAPPKNLEVHIFPGKSNIYNLYEDDGETNLFEQGYYLNTRFDYNYMQNNYTLIVRPIDGKSGIIPNTRNYKIRFRNTKQADTVQAMVNRDIYKAITYEDGNDFIVEVLEVSTTQQLTIICKGNNIELDAIRIINEDIDSILSDLKIKTSIKEEIAKIIYSELTLDKKKIAIKKLRLKGLEPKFRRMFIRLLDNLKDV